MILTHESGAVHHLKWRGMSETFSQIRDARGTQQTVGKEHLTIALRLSQHMLTERHVRFQDPSFHRIVAESSVPLTAHLHFLRTNNRIHEAPASQQFHDFVQAISNHFWWIVGTYDVEFYFRSPHRAKLKKRKWQFSLTQLDLDRLQGNRELIAEDLERTIVGPQAGEEPQDGEEPQEGAEPQPIGWQWVNPALDVVE